MGGHDPYSVSKGCSELITTAYRKSFFEKLGILLASGRAGNVIGGGDWADYRLVPDCAKALSKEEEIVLRNPTATRPWQLVLEPISGYLHLGQKLLEGKSQFADGWNFGPADDGQLSVEDVVKGMIEAWGQGSYRVELDKIHHEAHLLKLDGGKTSFYLKWKPVYSGKEAISQTAKWYKEFYTGKEMKDFSKKQIEDYVNKAKEMNIDWAK